MIVIIIIIFMKMNLHWALSREAWYEMHGNESQWRERAGWRGEKKYE